MNSVSWFLYAVDVLSSSNIIATILLFGTAIGFGFSLFWAKTNKGFGEKDKDYINGLNGARNFKKPFFILLFLVPLLPSERTLYLIMGSEISETVMTSDIGKKVSSAIDKKLDEYLAEK
ncbi:MAG: hypothetical protein V3T32_08015 [Thermodesulfobacteriota bacterium]